MIANYHTHTWRCGHAEGSEQDYIQQAIKAGLKTLGFSDHTPYDFFDSEPRNRPMRMKPEELPEYAASIRKLEILQDKGKVTAAIAKAFAESEFEQYRIIQDCLYQSDFDRLIAATQEDEDANT